MSGESALEEDPPRDRLADAYVEAVIMRRLAELNRFREQHVQHHNLSDADRREYIRNVLLSRVRRFCVFLEFSSSNAASLTNLRVILFRESSLTLL
jgi:hypothetical protein